MSESDIDRTDAEEEAEMCHQKGLLVVSSSGT